MKSVIIVLFIIAMVCLVFFLMVRNQKDKKELEEQLKENYPKEKESDTENNESLQ